jgi:predicted class III extradiol MEMO1 family dioxygenase
LSHVGENFGDERELDEAFLRHVEQRDRKALEHVTARQAEAFRQAVADDDNSTRVCSAGSIFALMTALDRAFGASHVEANVLRYHQAVNKDWETCVTCAAVAFTLKE